MIPLLPVDAIIARLSAEHARQGVAVLASDADGTLWDGDVGIDLFEALLAAEGVREAARGRLAAEAGELGITVNGRRPTSLAIALYAAYASDRYPHDRALAMMAWAFAGWHRDEVRAFAEQVLDEGRIEARIRPEMRRLLAWAEANGVPIYVASASPIAIVEAGVSRLGVTALRALAMTPAIDERGVLLPRIDGPIVNGDGKIRALEAAGVNGTILGAFGDSRHDAPMLRAARVSVAVTPAPHLREIASTIAGLIELERDN
jgi:phosphatidylglycerophosphatase C